MENRPRGGFMNFLQDEDGFATSPFGPSSHPQHPAYQPHHFPMIYTHFMGPPAPPPGNTHNSPLASDSRSPSPANIGQHRVTIDVEPTDDDSRQRMYYTPEEDIRLISAWINNCTDPIEGNSKRLARYWEEVVAAFNTTTKTFQSVGHDWGFSRLIKKSTLRELLRRLNNGGRFTIRCVLVIKDSMLHTEDVGAAVVVPQPKLQQDLIDMLRSGEGADVSFSVDGQLFPAHNCILAARSMVFKAELFGTTKEKDAQCIEIEDVEPAIFEALLHFVYTDSLLHGADNNVATQHLLVAADRYGLDRLRLLCEAKLCRDINVQTVATTLVLAEQHHCTQLKGACIEFIASRDVLGAVMETDGFKYLITSCPAIMKLILDKVAAVWSGM